MMSNRQILFLLLVFNFACWAVIIYVCYLLLG